jgi:hypothetical protein
MVMSFFPLPIKRACLAFAVCLFAVVANAHAAPENNEISFEAASQQAKAQERLLVLEFFSYNAAESKMLRDIVLGAASVKELLAEKFIVVPIQVERQAELCRRYGVTRPGVLVVTRADGTELDRLGGRMSPDRFLELLQAGLSGHSNLDPLVKRASAAEAGVEAHFALGQAYAQRRQSELALREFTWCLEQGPLLDPKGYRKHLPVLLARMGALSAELPAAKTVLEDQREKARQAVAASPTAVGYQVLFKFNTALKQSGQNTEAYLGLPANAPLRAQLFGNVFASLVEQRRYREAATAVDLETFVGRTYPLVPDECNEPTEVGAKHDHDHQALHRQRIAELTVPAVEALLGAGFPEKARRVAGRALDFDGGRYLRVRLIEGAQRAATTDASTFVDWVKAYQPSATASASTP